MNLQYFPQFVRANYKQIVASNEELNEIGIEFKKYLQKKFKGKLDKLELLWAIDPKDVIPNIGNPLKINGYHPALCIHFNEFCKEFTTKS